ncbi:MAG: DUF4124 domain-containing protein [Candidatus Methylumidiphilus sp.]
MSHFKLGIVILLLPLCAGAGTAIFKCVDSTGQIVYSDMETACNKPAPLDESPNSDRALMVSPKKPAAHPLSDDSETSAADDYGKPSAPPAPPKSPAAPRFTLPVLPDIDIKKTVSYGLLALGLLVALGYAAYILARDRGKRRNAAAAEDAAEPSAETIGTATTPPNETWRQKLTRIKPRLSPAQAQRWNGVKRTFWLYVWSLPILDKIEQKRKKQARAKTPDWD